MQLYLIILHFIIGISFGSFVTMFSYRIVKGEDFIFNPSYCPKCLNKLRFLDLIPLISFLLSKAKCRYCKNNISIRYFLIELFLGIIFVCNFLLYGISINTLLIHILAILLLIIIITDLEHYIIPDSMQIALMIAGVMYVYFILNNHNVLYYIYAPLFGLIFGLILKYGCIFFLKKDGLGMGDVKFFAVASLFLGIKGFFAFLFYAGIIGVMFGSIWLKINKNKGISIFPFGPALAISLYILTLFPKFIDLFWNIGYLVKNYS